MIDFEQLNYVVLTDLRASRLSGRPALSLVHRGKVTESGKRWSREFMPGIMLACEGDLVATFKLINEVEANLEENLDHCGDELMLIKELFEGISGFASGIMLRIYGEAGRSYKLSRAFLPLFESEQVKDLVLEQLRQNEN